MLVFFPFAIKTTNEQTRKSLALFFYSKINKQNFQFFIVYHLDSADLSNNCSISVRKFRELIFLEF